MTRTDLLIVGEPRGAQLRALLELGLVYCDRFLVATTGVVLSARAAELLSRLEPFLLDRRETSEYPAGSLPWGTVTVATYGLDPGSLELLLSAAVGLFDWCEPELPGDLCLLRGGEPWLITMASDGEAVLSLEDVEWLDLRQRLPELRLIPAR